MNIYNLRVPAIDDIIIAPLAYPNGAYMTIDGIKKPVLARVKSVFSETVNVINYFGYTYNVPLKHIEFVTSPLDSDFFVDMINTATTIMHDYGYSALSPNDFFTQIQYQKYNNIPIFQTIAVNVSAPLSTSINGSLIIGDINNIDSNIIISNKNGVIDLMVFDNIDTLHYVKKSNIMIYYHGLDLLIPGYGKFVIDGTHKYRDSFYENRIIFKSKKQFIDVAYKVVINGQLPSRDYGFYEVQLISEKNAFKVDDYVKVSVMIKRIFPQMGGSELGLTSDDIKEGEMMEEQFIKHQPSISWSKTPDDTRDLLFLCYDPDANNKTWIHWFVYNINPKLRDPDSGINGVNSFGNNRYDGPHPPQGSVHHYHFKLFALNKKMLFNPMKQYEYEEIMKKIDEYIITSEEIVCLYEIK